MTAADPQVVHDVGFQLSFSATLGLMTLAPQLATQAERLARRWPGIDRFPLTRPAVELAAVTLAAVAFTLPITAVNFHAVSLVAPLANVLAVPAFLAVAVTGAITAAVGALVPAAAQPLGLLAWPPAAYMAAVVGMAADIPLASVEVRGVGTGHAIAYYAALAGAVWLLAQAAAGGATRSAASASAVRETSAASGPRRRHRPGARGDARCGWASLRPSRAA